MAIGENVRVHSRQRIRLQLLVAVPFCLQGRRAFVLPITLHQLQHAAVGTDQFVEEKQRLVVRLPVPAFVQQIFAISHQLAEAQPLAAEIFRQGNSLGRIQQTRDLFFQHSLLQQAAILPELQQLGIRRAGPEEIGQARGQLQAVDGIRRALRLTMLEAIQKFRRHQNHLEHMQQTRAAVLGCRHVFRVQPVIDAFIIGQPRGVAAISAQQKL